MAVLTVNSLLARRWLLKPRWTASKEVVCPRYHAVGVSGDGPEIADSELSTNAGFGLVMLPTEPRRLRCDGIPDSDCWTCVLTDNNPPYSARRGCDSGMRLKRGNGMAVLE